MLKKNRCADEENAIPFNLDKSKVVKVVKDTLAKNQVDTKHKVLWDDRSGTKVDAQVNGHD